MSWTLLEVFCDAILLGWRLSFVLIVLTIIFAAIHGGPHE